jgi:hypothetical protein
VSDSGWIFRGESDQVRYHMEGMRILLSALEQPFDSSRKAL